MYLICNADCHAVCEIDIEPGEVYDGGRNALLDGPEQLERILLHPSLLRVDGLHFDLVV